MNWPVEDIPNEDALFYRVHYNDIDENGLPKPGAFRNSPKTDPKSGMSVNWEKYSDAEGARQGARKPASEYSVIKLIAGRVREVDGLTVVHEPDEEFNNRAHSQVYGEKNTEARAKLMDRYEISLNFDSASKLQKQ